MQFHINKVYFDRSSKDLVKLTNGTDAGGVFIPTEGVVIRAVGFRTVKGKEIMATAYTYKAVKPEDLSECDADEAFNGALALVTSGRI